MSSWQLPATGKVCPPSPTPLAQTPNSSTLLARTAADPPLLLQHNDRANRCATKLRRPMKTTRKTLTHCCLLLTTRWSGSCPLGPMSIFDNFRMKLTIQQFVIMTYFFLVREFLGVGFSWFLPLNRLITTNLLSNFRRGNPAVQKNALRTLGRIQRPARLKLSSQLHRVLNED